VTIKKVELLAPVGSMESLFAAVQNGADAVYLGGKLFNARQYAANFDDEDLKRAVEYAHLRDVKVYVTVNILIDDSEMKDTLRFIKYLYDINVDGIIVQDLGLAYLIRNIFPNFDLHASTQMTINNLPGAIFLRNFGFKRVVLARETPLEEIRRIHNSTDIQLEGFIHGALCVCYSGQCLMSSILGGRSGNRGRCAQPCRMAYSLIDYEKGEIVFDEWKDKYLISPKDLNTLEYLDQIVDSGIYSLKIEGRMKRPEYVATIVKNYRQALDCGISSLTEENREDVLQIFNRGFTKGLPLKDFGRNFISYDRPNNRGMAIGKVEKVDNKSIYIRLSKDLEKGDGIEIETAEGKYKGMVVDFSGNKGELLKIDRFDKVLIGSTVYRTSKRKLIEDAISSFEEENIKYPIDMEATISIGKPARLTIDFNDKRIEVESDYVVEKAQKVGLTEERVKEQLLKLNDTLYYVDKISIYLDENAFMPVKEINGLRRKGIEKLNEYRLSLNSREAISDEEFNIRLNKYFSLPKKEKVNVNRVSVKVLRKEQFDQLDLNKLDRIYIGFDEDLIESILAAKDKGKEVYILTDRILYSKDLDLLKVKIEQVKDIIDGVSVSNLGTLQFIVDNFNINIHGDLGLNVFNSFTVEALKQNGIKSITLSSELNTKQISRIVEKNQVEYEAIAYGYLPLMIMKHCPMALVKNCKDDHNCESCKFNSGYGLKDRKGINFYMERRHNLTTLYNSVPLFMLDTLDKIYKVGVDTIRLDFTFEKDNILEIQNMYYDFAKGLISKDEITQYCKEYRDKNPITKGHYFRGVI
jgi:putative protease